MSDSALVGRNNQRALRRMKLYTWRSLNDKLAQPPFDL